MIENERKYVLALKSYAEVEKYLQDVVAESIMQGYVKGARFRKQNDYYTFNFKLKHSEGVEEFEKQISRDEFYRCFKLCDRKLKKTRYTLVDTYGNTWDIDFFFYGSDLYFAMAECEMSDAAKEKPEELIPFVKDFCIFEVPRSQYSKYTSAKLTDVEYARKLLTLH